MRMTPPEKPKGYSEIRLTSHSDNSDNSLAVVMPTGIATPEDSDNSLAVVTVTEVSSEFEWDMLAPSDTRIPLPLDSLPKSIAELCSAVSQSLQVPTDLVFLPALAVLAGATRGRYRVQAKSDHVEPLALFTAVFMNPGERKSPTLALVAEPLKQAEKQLAQESARAVRDSLEQHSYLQKRVEITRTQCAKNPDKPEAQAEYDEARGELSNYVPLISPRLIATDVTPEALATLMSENGGSLTQLSDEGGFLKNIGGRYNSGSANLDLVNQGYSGGTTRVDRQGREPVFIEHAHLAIGLAVQPDVLEEMKRSGEMKARGLLDRFLFAQPESWQGARIYRTPEVPAKVREQWCSGIHNLVSEGTALLASGEYNTLALTPDSLSLYEHWWNETESQLGTEGDLVPFRGWVSKYSGMVLRIAALFALFEDPQARQVQAAHMQAALSLWGYWLGQTQYVLGSPLTGNTARVLAAVQKVGTQQFTVRDVHLKVQNQNWAKGDTANKIKAELAHLARAGYVRHLPVEGTRSDRWELHPDLIR